MKFDLLLETVAKDCIDSNQRRTSETEPTEFTTEQNEKYRKLDPEGKFWGGYAYIEEDSDGEVVGFIRLYSPRGSSKWVFTQKDGKLTVDSV